MFLQIWYEIKETIWRIAFKGHLGVACFKVTTVKAMLKYPGG